MRKRMFGIAMIALLCLLLGAVFGVQSFHSRAEAAAPADVQSPSPAPVDTPIPADDWQAAYETILSAFAEKYADEYGFSNYQLYDLDADGVPELIIGSGSCEADYKYSLYRFDAENGAEFVVNFGYGHSALCGLSGENALLIHGAHMGYEWVDRLRWTGTLYEQDHVLEGRMLDENTEYLPLEPLGYYRLGSLDGLDWAGNPADENAAILAPLRMEDSLPDSYVSYRQLVARSGLPADSRFLIHALDSEGTEELLSCYDENAGMAAVRVDRLSGGKLETLFLGEGPLVGAANLGLYEVLWEGENRLVYFYSNGEAKEADLFETVTEYTMLDPDGSPAPRFTAVLRNGELAELSPENGIGPDAYRAMFDGVTPLLSYAAKFDTAGDLAQDYNSFLGWGE